MSVMPSDKRHSPINALCMHNPETKLLVLPVPIMVCLMIPHPQRLAVPALARFVISWYRAVFSCLKFYFLVVEVFLVVLSSAFLVVVAAFDDVILATVLTEATGALVVVAPAAKLGLAAGALEADALASETLDAALTLAEVARVVPDTAAIVLDVAELELELADPDDAVFQYSSRRVSTARTFR